MSNATSPVRISETRKVGSQYIVHKYSLVGMTDRSCIVYAVYERAVLQEYSHSVCTSLEGEMWWKVVSRRLPGKIISMPKGDTLVAAIAAFLESNYVECYRVILEAYLEAESGDRVYGHIEVWS